MSPCPSLRCLLSVQYLSFLVGMHISILFSVILSSLFRVKAHCQHPHVYSSWKGNVGRSIICDIVYLIFQHCTPVIHLHLPLIYFRSDVESLKITQDLRRPRTIHRQISYSIHFYSVQHERNISDIKGCNSHFAVQLFHLHNQGTLPVTR